MGTKRPPLDEVLSLMQATVAAEGITTGAGAADGKSIVDANLALSGANSFFSMLMVLYPGQPRLVDSMDITGFTNATGEVIFSTAYKGIAAAIPAGVPYKIVTFRFVPAEVATLAASLGLMADAATADDLSDVTTTSAHAKLRRLLLRMSGAGVFSADIQGVARTELDTMLAQLAIYFNTAGAALSVVSQPGVAAKTTLNAILTDLADILAGATGITNFPGPAAPANDVSLAEVLHQIYDDVVAIGGGSVLLDTQIRKVASGTSGIIATTASKYIELDSGTNSADILAVIINGVVGFDWTLAVYVPTADAVAAPAAGDKRDSITYLNTDTEGGLLGPFAIAYNAFLKFTNNSAGNQTVNDVVVIYRSRAAITIGAWA